MEIYKCKEVKTPERGTPGSAGIDFFVPDRYPEITLPADCAINIPAGIHVKVPVGFALILFNKSGIALKKNLIVGAAVIDEDYQGEIHLHVINVGTEPVKIQGGMKLVQGLLLPVSKRLIREANSLEELYSERTLRGTGGFGSTGE